MSDAMNSGTGFWETLVAGFVGGGSVLTLLQWVFGAGTLKQQLRDLAARLEEQVGVAEKAIKESQDDRRELWAKVNTALTKDDLQGINETLNRIQMRIDYLISGRFPPVP